MSKPTVIHTPDELQTVVQEALKRHAAGDVTNVIDAFRLGQQALPLSRRRNDKAIDGISKVKNFAQLLKRHLPELPTTWTEHIKRARLNEAESPAPAESVVSTEPEMPVVSEEERIVVRVRWTAEEKELLVNEAARIFSMAVTGSRIGALEIAQKNVLPPNRHRQHLGSAAQLRAWYLPALKLELERLKNAAQSPPTPEAATPSAQAIQAAIAPVASAIPLSGETQAVAADKPASMLDPLVTMMASQWGSLRERLVNEIASIVVDGIQRGLQTVTTATPMQQTPSSASDIEMQSPPPMHTPYIKNGTSAPSKPSVLVVGLKGEQTDLIRQEFQKRLDLRFCTSDQSKDHLKKMAEAADVSVVFAGFVSHSHTDIVKARSPHYYECHGGMTRLRERLEQVATLGPSLPTATTAHVLN